MQPGYTVEFPHAANCREFLHVFTLAYLDWRKPLIYIVPFKMAQRLLFLSAGC